MGGAITKVYFALRHIVQIWKNTSKWQEGDTNSEGTFEGINGKLVSFKKK